MEAEPAEGSDDDEGGNENEAHAVRDRHRQQVTDGRIGEAEGSRMTMMAALSMTYPPSA